MESYQFGKFSFTVFIVHILKKNDQNIPQNLADQKIMGGSISAPPEVHHTEVNAEDIAEEQQEIHKIQTRASDNCIIDVQVEG